MHNGVKLLPIKAPLSLLLGLALSVSNATAEDAIFAIRGYSVSGNTVVASEKITQSLAPYTGEGKTFETIQDALKALEKQYADAGFGAVRVLLPEQEVEDGMIRLHVVEATVGKILVEGNKYFDEDNIRASVPALRQGEMPNMDRISASLRIANENGSKQTDLIFRPSHEDGKVDALLRVADEIPGKFALSLDNTGTQATGNFRFGLLAQHANLFGLDHTASAQLITSPGHEGDVTIVGLGYKIPLYARGDSIDFSYGYSNVNSGTVQVAGGSLGISGQGQIASARYNLSLPGLGDWEQRLAFGLDYRAYANNVTPTAGGNSLIPDITVHPLSLTYLLSTRGEQFDLSGYFTWSRNIPGGAHGSQSDFDASRAGASANYQTLRYGLSGNRLIFDDWLLRTSFAGQYTSDSLVSGEQFGIAGQDTVRGFLEREVAGDKGQRLSLEIHSPDFAGKLGLDGFRTQGVLFHDIGRILRNRPTANEIDADTIASAGIGLRLGYGRNLSFKLDYAIVTQAGGAQKRGDGRLHGSLLWFF